MRKIVLYIAIFCMAWFTGHAQDDKQGKARLQSLEIAYITKELNLSPEEAEKFWPVYNKYAGEMRAAIKSGKDEPDILDKQQELLDIRKKYRTEFLKVLSQERVNRLFNAQDKFREIIRREWQQRQLQKEQLNPHKRGG